MKSLLILAFAGLACSSQWFRPGQEYVYTYSGRILTGIPQIDSTFAGMGIRGRVIVQATSQDTYKLMMKNVQFGAFNEQLSGPEPRNWRNVEIESSTPLAGEYQRYMESPVEFRTEQGQFRTVSVSSNEPQWSVNFKKALIASIKISPPEQSSGSDSSQDGRRNPRFWYRDQQTSQGQYYWTTMEEGIEGKCENTYHVSELPEYLVNEYEQGMMKSERCQGKKYYQVMRTKDMAKCQDRSLYLSSQGHQNCLIGNCETSNTKQSQTRYYGCGENVDSMELQGMINEGELQHSVVAFNTETVVTGTKQILKLEEVRSRSTEIPEIDSARTCHDLSYEFPQSPSQGRKISSRQDQREILKELSQNPERQTFSPYGDQENINTEQIKRQMVERLQQISSDISQVDQFAEKELASQLRTLTSLVSVLTTSDLKEIYQTIRSNSNQHQETARTLYIELVRNSGTSPAVIFLKEMVEQDQISETEKFLVLSTFTHYIKTPTEELIDQIFQMIKSDAVSSKSYLKYPAHLAFSNLLSTACLQSSKTNKVYPEHVFGRMCSSNNQKISEEYIPHFVQELQNAQTETERQMALYVLGQTGHESVLSLIISYVEGRDQSDQSGSPSGTRKAAMYSLLEYYRHNPQHRNHLLPVYLSILHNPAESRQLRIAAVLCVMNMQPTTVQLQKMAVSTWFEEDFEVAKYIYSSLKSYAQLSADSHPQDSKFQQLSQQCQTVLQLAKPLYHVFSVNQVSSGYLPELQIGATMINSLMKGMSGTEVYHKTEYYLKQVQTVPMEFAGHVSGLSTIVKSMMKAIKPSQGQNHLLREILNKLEVSPRSDAQFEAGAWLRLSDDINFGVEINQGHIDVMKQKVQKVIKDSGVKVMEKICGRHPFNYNNVFEELPYQAVVPSDLGLPIIVESQMTYLVSLQGEVNLECSLTRPSAQLELSKKLSYTYNGQAGTVCPFSQQMLTAGINIHRATNIPVTTKVELEPQSSKLRLSMNPSSQVNSNNNNIDVHHYHVKPYTSMKPSVFQDATPSVLSPNTRIIQSRASPKTFQAEFGQSLGVDLKLKVETECDLYDKKTMLDSWSNYHYNPLAASWFFFTETALTAEGRPTARLHKYTITHNPSQSSTKGAEMEVELSLSSKVKGEETKKIKLTSSSTPQSHHAENKLESCLTKLKSKYGYAFNAQINCRLTGAETQTYTYSLTAGAGNDEMEHRWDLDLHLQNQNRKVCMEGSMKYPTTPSSQANFQYENKLGFGENCEQYYVNVEGHSQVSQEQRQKSHNSKESQKCEAKSQEEERLRQKIKTVTDEEEKKKVEKKHAKIALEKLKSCSKKTEQSRTVDSTEFDISYSQELPQQVYDIARTANTGLKAALFQYVSRISSPRSGQQQIKVQLNFNQEVNTVSLRVESPEDRTEYRDIRLPSQLQGVLPLVAGQNPAEQTYKALTGESYLSKCVVGQGYIQTFDRRTYSYQIDECDHVAASDCSGDNDHAVMVLTKEVNGMKHITILAGQTKIQVRPARAYTNQVEEYTVTVNGEEQQLRKNSEISLSSDKRITAYLTEDRTVVISTPSSRITHSGKTVEIEESGPADGSHCGLCGDHNNDRRADLKSPKKCIFKSDSLFGKSYRSKSSQCPPLPQQTQQKIKEEEQRCAKYETKKTHVSSIYSSGQKDSYSTKKHSYIYKEDKICISQDPVVKCSSGSIPESMKKKMIKFVCLPEGRVSKLYSERIERGESPQELKHQPIAFQAEMEVPVKCGPKKV